jgi:hypothetical protein
MSAPLNNNIKFITSMANFYESKRMNKEFLHFQTLLNTKKYIKTKTTTTIGIEKKEPGDITRAVKGKSLFMIPSHRTLLLLLCYVLYLVYVLIHSHTKKQQERKHISL